MRTTADFSEHQRQRAIAHLEAQFRKKPQQSSTHSITRQTIWQAVQAVMVALAGSSEPRIQQVGDRTGTPRWRAYDPITGQVTFFSSEAEVRVWLEQRYYR